uniref:Uncharacterized protein n=1 Tax=Grapevine virus B TaxID=35289 RepID=A0A7S6NFX2_9VIRU|nr:hypothetical protein GVB_gp2 [Grapevine virus B]
MNPDGLSNLKRQIEGLNLSVQVLGRVYSSLDVCEAQQYRILSLLCRINKVSVSFLLSCFVKRECALDEYRPGIEVLKLEEVIEKLISNSLPSVFKVREDFEQGSVSFNYPWCYCVTREPGEKRQYKFSQYVPGLKERIKALPWMALGFTASTANNPLNPGSHTYSFKCIPKT